MTLVGGTTVLVDTSVWVDHFRQRNEILVDLLERDRVIAHPLVVGEMACGTPPQRARTLADLASLRQAHQASIREMMDCIERQRWFGLGCGLIDLMLLCSTLLTPSTQLWTFDRRLNALAKQVGVNFGVGVH